MQTTKCFEQDPYVKELSAVVLECRPLKEGYGLVLDRTIFFPEGGGQPADRGIINGIPVTDVQIINDQIIHTVGEAIPVGTEVACCLDWERRFDLMQQHSGEHIVSGIVHSLFGYENVGFHMGERITVDWDGPLTEEQLRQVERLANEVIWRNERVQVSYPDDIELSALNYRSKKELEGQVRIVTYPGVDVCACCGTHVARTGEIGLAKLLTVTKFRSGVRVEMLFGKRALEHCSRVLEENHKTSVLLSAKEYDTSEAVQRLYDEHQSVKYKLTGLENRYFKALACQQAGAGDCLLIQEGLSPNGVRRLADEVMSSCGGRCAVFSGSDEAGYHYAMGQMGGDLRTLTREMNQALNGRGGGKPFFVQGAVKATENDIRQFFAGLEG